MKILHIMQREKFTAGVVGFYDKYFANGEHEICYLNLERDKPLINEALLIKQREIYLSGNMLKDIRLIGKELHADRYDYIVAHSLLLPVAFKIYLATHRSALKKLVWIEWGADLYLWKPKTKGIKAFVRTKMEQKIRTKLSDVVCIFPPDCELYKKTFAKSRADVYYAPYCSCVDKLDGKEYVVQSHLEQTKKNEETVYIQVGHSAAPALNHIEALDALKKFADEDIKIFLPLNYGDMEYADRVADHARSLFGDKAIILREMMSRDEYFALLERIDIAIFNTYRQIALGNIGVMVFRNVKLYMPQESVMYSYFEENGAPICTLESLKDISFDEFSTAVYPADVEAFREYLRAYHSVNEKMRSWEKIYNSLKDKLTEKR